MPPGLQRTLSQTAFCPRVGLRQVYGTEEPVVFRGTSWSKWAPRPFLPWSWCYESVKEVKTTQYSGQGGLDQGLEHKAKDNHKQGTSKPSYPLKWMLTKRATACWKLQNDATACSLCTSRNKRHQEKEWSFNPPSKMGPILYLQWTPWDQPPFLHPCPLGAQAPPQLKSLHKFKKKKDKVK